MARTTTISRRKAGSKAKPFTDGKRQKTTVERVATLERRVAALVKELKVARATDGVGLIAVSKDARDRRTRDGRRYQDIVLAVIAEFGPANPVALRELAALRFTLEREQGAIVSGGDQRSLEDLVRLTNTVERKERALRAARRAAGSKPPPGLHARLAAKYGVKGDAP
jgi:hypothetical protein